MEINLESLRVTNSEPEDWSYAPAGKLFLKGPVPIEWLSASGRRPGKAMHVAVVIWFLSGLKRRKRVKLEPSKLRLFGITPQSANRGLKQLESVGLISVERKRGRAPWVTILCLN